MITCFLNQHQAQPRVGLDFLVCKGKLPDNDASCCICAHQCVAESPIKPMQHVIACTASDRQVALCLAAGYLIMLRLIQDVYLRSVRRASWSLRRARTPVCLCRTRT